MLNDNKSLSSNFIWAFIEKWSMQIASAIISVLLMRLLSPSDYGVVSVVMVFLSFFQAIVDLGLTNSLIQKNDIDNNDYSTVFVVCNCASLVFFCAVYLLSPYVSRFEGIEITAYIRVAALSFIISPFKNIMYAYVSKNMMFKKFFISSITGTILGSLVGLILAYKGFGAWALIINNLVDSVVDSVVLMLSIKWKPSLSFNKKSFDSLFSYSWKLSLSSLLNTIYDQFYQLLIAKFYSASSFAYYDKGKSVPLKLTINIDGAVNSVLFPDLSNKQDDLEEIKNEAKKMIKILTYTIFPMMFGLFAVSKLFVCIIYTEKWLPIVPYLKIFCFIQLLRPFHSVNLNVIKSVGRSDIFLKQEILKKIIGVIFILLTIKSGVFVISLGLLVLDVVCVIVNSNPNKLLINYGLLDQIKDAIPNIFSNMLMFIAVKTVQPFLDQSILSLLVQIGVGITAYIAISVIIKNESFYFLIRTLKKYIIHSLKTNEA